MPELGNIVKISRGGKVSQRREVMEGGKAHDAATVIHCAARDRAAFEEAVERVRAPVLLEDVRLDIAQTLYGGEVAVCGMPRTHSHPAIPYLIHARLNQVSVAWMILSMLLGTVNCRMLRYRL